MYGAPPGAGKSMVAELLMLRAMAVTGRIALLVLPFVSLLGALGATTVRCWSGMPPVVMDLLTRPCCIVCTMEMGKSILDDLLEHSLLRRLCCVVVDELHLVGRPSMQAF